MDTFLRDVRYVTRALLRTPGFLAVTVVTLALGVGATTAIFSVIHGVLLRPLPYDDPDRIVQVWQISERGGRGQVSDPNYDDLKAQSRSFAALAQFQDAGIISVSGATEPVRVRGALVSADFFPALGVRPIRGRTFVAEEQRVGGVPAVMVSHGFWQRQLGGRADLTGLTVTFDNDVYAVVGVMQAELDFPVGVDLWAPRERIERNPHRTGHNWQVVGRLRDGVTLPQARGEVSAIARRLKQQYGDDTWMVDAALVPLREQLVGHVRAELMVLLAASAFLLLIACANVVNLLVARMAARQGEVALRLALGAGRGRLVRQFLAESLVLSLAGGVLGVVLAMLGVKALLALEPEGLPRLSQIGINWVVLAFALGVSVLTAVTLGLITALRGTAGDLRGAMAQSQRTQAGAGASYRIRGTLVVAQMALTLVLLVGAGLLGRSFLRLAEIDPGYRTERALVLDMSVPVPEGDAGLRERVRLYDEIIARLRVLPGVAEVGGVNALPLAGGNRSNGTFLVMSRPDEPLDMAQLPKLAQDPARTGEAEYRIASAGYFRAMDIPLRRGRMFDDRDGPDAPHVALITESLASAEFPGDDPIGKIIQFGNMDGDMRPFTVVGVVGDVREASLAERPRPTLYAHYRQRARPAGMFHFVMQGDAPDAALVPPARRIVADLRPDVAPRFRTIETVVARSVADRRFILTLVTVFGSVALVLATLGVYSVIAYLVAQRSQEIGVRVALGAQSGDVLRLVLRQGAILAGVGIVVGAVAALGATRLLSQLLFGITATDPIAFGGVIVVLGLVALAASYIPARRATRVDPMTVLRTS